MFDGNLDRHLGHSVDVDIRSWSCKAKVAVSVTYTYRCGVVLFEKIIIKECKTSFICIIPL